MSVFILLIPKVKAQQDTIKLFSVKKNKENIEICISSKKGFIIGSERYVLHIGDSYFTKSIHPDGNENLIVFKIDFDSFSAIKNNNEMVLVYGLFDSNIKNKKTIGENRTFSGKHWKIGVLDKDLLNK